MRDVTPHVEAPEESATRSQFDVLTLGMKEKAALLPAELLEMKPQDLEDLVTPTTLQRRLKKRFWLEYHRVIGLGAAEIAPVSVYGGLCSKQYFYKSLIEHKEVFAWFLCPLNDYDLATEEALEFGIDRVREEILTVPLYQMVEALDEKTGQMKMVRGRFLKDNAQALLTAVKFLDARVKGTPLQRIQQANLHVHQTQTKGGITREELDKELLEIRQRLSGSNLPAVIVSDDDDLT